MPASMPSSSSPSSGGEENVKMNKSSMYDVNEEYVEAFRTKSYVDIWKTIQDELNHGRPNDIESNNEATKCKNDQHYEEEMVGPPSCSCSPSSLMDSDRLSSPSSCSSTSSISPADWLHSSSSSSLSSIHHHFPERLLIDPGIVFMDSKLLYSKSGNLRDLIECYFAGSAEACQTCGLLLQCIDKAESSHKRIQKVLKTITSLSANDIDQFTRNLTDEQLDNVMSELVAFSRTKNPLALSERAHFQRIHDIYRAMFKRLTSKRRKIMRKLKFILLANKAAGGSLIAACGGITSFVLFLATQCVVGTLVKCLKGRTKQFLGKRLSKLLSRLKKRKGNFKIGLKKLSELEGVGKQLDAAARGAFILMLDFDTISRLVAQLNHKIEHNHEIIKMCMRNREERHFLREVVKELSYNEARFVKQVEELKEHIYLCLVTINRARRQVVQEILDVR